MITKLRKSKKSWSAIFFSIFLVFLAIGLIGFLFFTNWKINQKRVELQQKIEALKKEIQVLEEKNTLLRTGISQTESEEYQTKLLYEQGYFEEGATPVVVLPPAEKKEEKTSEEKNLWHPQTWWEWLRNKK